jgi:tight adherence protein B
MRVDTAAAPTRRLYATARTWRPVNRLVVGRGPGPTLRLRRLTGSAPPRPALKLVAGGATTRLAGVVTSIGITLTALAWQGPLAALVAVTYATAVSLIVRTRIRAVRERAAATGALDRLCRYAADLRVGGHPSIAFADLSPRGSATAEPPVRGDAGRLPFRIEAACRVAEATGAPLADLLDRLETDARSTARLRTSAVAQAAGARATGWLLAALPVAGIALGYGIGTNPLRVLFHTAAGAVLTVPALALQIAGLAWTHRLTAAITDAA